MDGDKVIKELKIIHRVSLIDIQKALKLRLSSVHKQQTEYLFPLNVKIWISKNLNI